MSRATRALLATVDAIDPPRPEGSYPPGAAPANDELPPELAAIGQTEALALTTWIDALALPRRRNRDRSAMSARRLHQDDIEAIADAVARRLQSGRRSAVSASPGERPPWQNQKDPNVFTDHIDETSDEEPSGKLLPSERTAIERLFPSTPKPKRSRQSMKPGAGSTSSAATEPSTTPSPPTSLRRSVG